MAAYRLSLFLVFATFCLLLAGGLVHATDSGLACPDWPTCYGSFMPPMEGGILFEHSHRLIATFVGLTTIALLVVVRRSRGEDRAAVRMAWGALGLVIFQGVLGGLTVIFQLPTAVSTGHLATSMLYFSLVIVLAFRLRPGHPPAPARPAGSVRTWIGVTAAAVYAQVVLGALVRHSDVGLACTEIPLCKGALWLSPADPMIQLHMAHRIGGVVVTALVIATAVHAVRSAGEGKLLRLLACATPGLVTLQMGLGLLSVQSALEVVTVTAHLGTGALLLGCTVAMWLSVPGVPDAASAGAEA